MGWFKKNVDKIVKSDEEIAADNAAKELARAEAEKQHIEKMENEASIIKEKLSPYIDTYCLDRDSRIYSFNDVVYHKESRTIHYNCTFSTTKPGYTSFWDKMSLESMIIMLREDRERFVKLRNQYKHFGLELIKTSDKKSSQRNNKINDILGDNE